MHLEKIRKQLNGIPGMNFSQSQEITEVIFKNKIQHILEIGFAHGVSTCYMAGALDELARGCVTTIDLLQTQSLRPNIDQLLYKLEINNGVNVYYEPTSYIWRLMKMLEEDSTPRFDLCYFNSSYDAITDALGFYLVDKLLKINGLIIFDDLDWSYDGSATLKDSERAKNMPLEEKQTHQIRKVYEVLVKTHPAYGRFEIKHGWAYAYKMYSEYSTSEHLIRREIIYRKKPVTIGRIVRKIGKKIAINL